MSEPDPVTPDTPPPSPPVTADDGYAPPADLPEEETEAKCETDVKITIKEPNVTGVAANSHQGTNWIGVDGVEVVLSAAGTSFSATTSGGGVAEFSKVPCGAYVLALSQDEFRIEPLSGIAFTVSATRKSGREKEMKIKRQLRTVEMFRLPTQYIVSLQSNLGKDVATPDDPYGHHWLQIYASESAMNRNRPSESYGWWPEQGAINSRTATFTGVKGVLNGYSPSGPYGSYGGASMTTDPYHGSYSRTDPKLEDNFYPYVTNGKTAAEYKAELKKVALGFSANVSDRWAWRTDGGGWHCKTFQAHVMSRSNVWKRVGVGIGSFGWSTST